MQMILYSAVHIAIAMQYICMHERIDLNRNMET